MLTLRPKDLPNFHKPPVAETVLSLQFEPIPGLTTVHVGLLWQRFRQELPVIEEHPPLPALFESFEPPSPAQMEVTIEERPPLPRLWFANTAKTELIQVQSNRFIHNWRRLLGVEPYPHYEPIREKFRGEVAAFEAFLAEEGLGAVVVNQCEITYVNHISSSGTWDRRGELENVFSMWTSLPKTSFLPEPEDVGLRMRFLIPDATGTSIGRLHVVLNPAWAKTDNAPILALTLTARGRPIRGGIDGAFEFFDLGRKWIVKGFADLTTPEMHRVWERIKDA